MIKGAEIEGIQDFAVTRRWPFRPIHKREGADTPWVGSQNTTPVQGDEAVSLLHSDSELTSEPWYRDVQVDYRGTTGKDLINGNYYGIIT